MDELRSKWYSSLPCFGNDAYRPQPLGVASVAGVFILLFIGILAGCLTLTLEHLVYKYALPKLRHQPKDTIWRSPNMMFFSQKLYRFINCVELLSPHHAAKELMNSLRQGQITSLFQKSVKRKEIEQKRRRKSKAQFFEMIREVRRYQQEEKDIAEEGGTQEGGDDDDADDEEDNATKTDSPEQESLPHPHHPHTQHGDWSSEKHSERSRRRTSLKRCLKHPTASFAEPPSFESNPDDSSEETMEPNRLQKCNQLAKRRRSCSPDRPTNHKCSQKGVRFAVNYSPSQTCHSDPEAVNQEPNDRHRNSCWPLCSMIDVVTLNKLSKEEIFLLWQSSEVQWESKVATVQRQLDILLLRYQHAQHHIDTMQQQHQQQHPPQHPPQQFL